MPRLGVLGSMVWDTIHARDTGRQAPVEEWGGIAYALAAADAAVPADWSIFPIIKIGADLRDRADAFLATLGRVESLEGARTVPEPNNRVELFYHTAGRRCETLTGGTPAWTLEELLPLARSCDALYVNFIAGWEVDLAGATALRDAVGGPLYGDLHSLMLGIGPGGARMLRPLENWRAWLRSFDVVQMNDDELTTLADGREDPWAMAAEILGPSTGALLVTLGERGVGWVATREFLERPLGRGARTRALATFSERLISGKAPADRVVPEADPTGCGDVWGATCFCALLAGRGLEDSIAGANRAAARNAAYRGATGLNEYLRSPTGIVTGRAAR